MALFKPDPPASGDFFESCILSNSTDIVSSCLMLNCDDLSTEAHRVCKGFHLSSGGCWVKLPSRKAWRTEGLFELVGGAIGEAAREDGFALFDLRSVDYSPADRGVEDDFGGEGVEGHLV